MAVPIGDPLHFDVNKADSWALGCVVWELYVASIVSLVDLRLMSKHRITGEDLVVDSEANPPQEAKEEFFFTEIEAFVSSEGE